MNLNWFDKKILILGLSKSGISAAKYLNEKGADVFITEYRQETPEDKETIAELNKLGIQVETGGHSDEFIKDSYLAVTSPGIPPHSDIMKRLKDAKIPVISEIELAYTQAKNPFIAITGTNGKTTTTALTAHILGSEYKAVACGNYGKPPCDLLNEPIDYFVCECSSYQLEMSPSFKPQIAVWTNFSPDHTDWHQGIENYFKAKSKIFQLPQDAAFAVLNAMDERLVEFSKVCDGEIFFFGKDEGENCCYIKNDEIIFKRKNVEEKIIHTKDCPLIGEHNYQNIMCAVICAKLEGMENDKIREAIITFNVPEHRMEKFAVFNGIEFYNDSKATNPEAAIVAVKSFKDKNVVLIAGGRDKNTDLKDFCEAVNEHISKVILIGEAAQRFEENLQMSGFKNTEKATSVEEAVDKAISLNPDVILLSPACASFDMYSGYEERGEAFKEYVLSKSD